MTDTCAASPASVRHAPAAVSERERGRGVRVKSVDGGSMF